jgi:hypothetical protein
MATGKWKAHTAQSFKACGAALMLFSGNAFAVNWEQQAERLQQISATLLDGLPVPEPAFSRYGVGIKLDTSFLPEPNTTVGSKKEKVPSSPVHTVPSIKGYAMHDISRKFRLGGNVYAGYLVPGLEGIMGVKAKLSQHAFGGQAGVMYLLNSNFGISADLGAHLTGGSLTGGITAVDAKDDFTFNTTILHFTSGIVMPKIGGWMNLLVGTRSSESELKIKSDKTDLKTKDTLADADVPVLTQVAAGWTHIPTGASVGLAYLIVPARLYMPRMNLGFAYPIGPLPEYAKPISSVRTRVPLRGTPGKIPNPPNKKGQKSK